MPVLEKSKLEKQKAKLIGASGLIVTQQNPNWSLPVVAHSPVSAVFRDNNLALLAEISKSILCRYTANSREVTEWRLAQ